ncbi:uncharacterized protein EI90DRAFT_3012967 [Cantharellus anzutake]|uniref:uncharacterized protein n=1 Tax=Cantharellus anzutake TaxID=1750568 RepID=UPI001906F35C|nr:uncharacterized protein EI90DRAFT_3012967 [Cantharellus anzutake]KAF8338806.1 hypothetical protein EI90DRAFT_3012967 [Cantharellus anzutake]
MASNVAKWGLQQEHATIPASRNDRQQSSEIVEIEEGVSFIIRVQIWRATPSHTRPYRNQWQRYGRIAVQNHIHRLNMDNVTEKCFSNLSHVRSNHPEAITGQCRFIHWVQYACFIHNGWRLRELSWFTHDEELSAPLTTILTALHWQVLPAQAIFVVVASTTTAPAADKIFLHMSSNISLRLPPAHYGAAHAQSTKGDL